MVMRFEHGLDLLEIVLSVIVVVAFLVCLVPIVKDIPLLVQSSNEAGSFRHFLRNLFDLVIGIEFVKMLIKHTPSSVLEVMAFAIARHMVVTDTSPLEDLVAVLAVGVIFLVRRFSYIKSFESSKDELAMQWLEPTDITTEGTRNPARVPDEDVDLSDVSVKADEDDSDREA